MTQAEAEALQLEDKVNDLTQQLKEAKSELATIKANQEKFDMGKQVGSELSSILAGMTDGGLSEEFAEAVILQQLNIVQGHFGGML